jgi:hypothetical protein
MTVGDTISLLSSRVGISIGMLLVGLAVSFAGVIVLNVVASAGFLTSLRVDTSLRRSQSRQAIDRVYCCGLAVLLYLAHLSCPLSQESSLLPRHC